MQTQSFIRFGAVALAASGLALGYSYVTHPHDMTPETIASTRWIVLHMLFAVSLVLGLLGTTALYAVTAGRSGGVGAAGFFALFVGMMMIFGLDFYEVFIAPYLAQNYSDVILDHGAGDAMGWVALAFPLAGALTVIGYALLGYAWLKAGIVPRLPALALILSALAFGIGLSPLGGLALARVTAAAFGAALVWIGWWALRNGRTFAVSASP
jgi:hypothetical protein